MKRFLITIIAICSLVFSAFAQDQRQRTVDTIISDALASLPAANAGDLSREMLDLAKNAPESVVSIASMMTPSGKNSVYEYALSGQRKVLKRLPLHARIPRLRLSSIAR